MILLDTNILVRMTDPDDPQCAAARQAIRLLSSSNEQIRIVPQNLYEFWSVATRKPNPPPNGQNGLGMTAKQSSQWMQFFRRRFTLLPDRDDLVTLWHELVYSLGVLGTKSHDARLVAAMQSHGINKLLTFNLNHFRAFPITLLDPDLIQ